MHPVLTRYLDVMQAWDSLLKVPLQDAGRLSPEERWFHEALAEHPELRTTLTASRGKRHPPEPAQRALLAVATFAALKAVAASPELAPALEAARSALRDAGASEDEARAYLAALLAEEAFGYDDDPTSFDADFVEETLFSIPRLAALTSEAVAELGRAWSEAARVPVEVGQRAAGALLGAAWADGPEPINPEHLRQALGRLEGPEERRALRELLTFLAEQGLVGRHRLGRLLPLLPR